MTRVDQPIVVHFSYNVQTEFAFTLLTDVRSFDLTCAAGVPDALCTDIASQDQAGAMLLLARQDAAYRPKVRPVRPSGQTADRGRTQLRSRTVANGDTVRPAHPTHLLIVSARRPRPARLDASQPVAAAIAATRKALYPAVPPAPAAHLGLRTAAHCLAIAGVFMSAVQSAAAQQMLALF